ncbi:MAG: YHYH protein [Flavobacteriaceae bacterium]|nr:YHYH protein [Flavobacteriaceae bacterium]
MKNKIIAIATVLIFSVAINAQNKNGTFSVTDGIKCTTTLNQKNKVEILTKGDSRIITSNAIPNHKVGAFPNPGNPNTISEQQKSYNIPVNPKKTGKLIDVSADGFGKGFPAYEFGVALNGVKLEPTAAEFFGGRGEHMNSEWALEALSTAVNLGDDCNNAHVQPTGEYHYHGTPWEFIKEVTSKSMSQVGWAADGFPIYYKYGYKDPTNTSSEIVSLVSSYQLKKGNRPGNGKTAPDGVYDGTYVRDFEFVEGLGDLDIANGRFGITPEFPNGTYYYVITDDFPSLPRYFVGTPSKDFAVGGGILGNGGRRMARNKFGSKQNNRRQGPSAKEILKMMDANKDGKISEKEAKGPLKEHFDVIDTNKDGFITKKELEKAPKPNNQRRRNRRN